ncbi:MAG: class I SAM-dependent methyltransferase [Acidimicrobiales bacterium]
MASRNPTGRSSDGLAKPVEEQLHRAAVDGYQRQSEAYVRSRPSYHPAIVERVVELHQPEPDSSLTLIEIGAGTGIFTEQMAETGLTVRAVEPVEAMRSTLERRLPGVAAIDGAAERLPFESDSAATVVAAQAFHWFDYEAALDEIARVLAVGGHLITVWNVRDNLVPWVAGVTALIDRYSDGTPRHHTMRWRLAIDGDERFTLVEDFGMDHPWPATPDGVVDRTMSTSFIGALDPAEQAVVVAEIRAIVEPLGPTFDYPYISELQAWRLGPA